MTDPTMIDDSPTTSEDADPSIAPLLPENRPWSELGRFVFFDATGRIASEIRMQVMLVSKVAQDHGGLSWLQLSEAEQVDLAAHYVSGGSVVARPPNPATLDGMKLLNLPAPCIIAINGIEYECADTEAELDFDQPGPYSIVVSAWPHLDKSFTL